VVFPDQRCHTASGPDGAAQRPGQCGGLGVGHGTEGT